MNKYIDKTILVTGPKRAGKTLLLRMFDNEQGFIHFIDEAFFWEHVYNYQALGLEDIFIDMYRHFSPDKLMDAIIDRDILPGLNGVFKQLNPVASPNKFTTVGFNFQTKLFLSHLDELKNCTSVAEIWNILCHAYDEASTYDNSVRRTAFMMSGDSGKSMIASKRSLDDCRSIFIVRDPYLAMDSLKISRNTRGQKILNPVNFAQVITYYRFIMDNKHRILHENTLLVRYEDLIECPEYIMQEVAVHCGIDYSKNLITPTLLGQKWGTNSALVDALGIDRSSGFREIKALDSLEIQFISKHMSDYIDFFGYKLR